jgi:hypothetical protein
VSESERERVPHDYNSFYYRKSVLYLIATTCCFFNYFLLLLLNSLLNPDVQERLFKYIVNPDELLQTLSDPVDDAKLRYDILHATSVLFCVLYCVAS